MQAMANVNGKITKAEEAVISIFDRSFMYGDSIYEVVRTYNGVPYGYDDHWDRLENSARLAKIKLSQSREFLKKEIQKTIFAANIEAGEDIFIRYTITRGTGPLDLDPASVKQTNYVIIVKEIPAWNIRYLSEGVKLAIPRTRRNSPLSLDPNIKSGNYLNNIFAVQEAKELGADDACILSIDGKITESSNSNIGFIINGAIVYPSHDGPNKNAGNLSGITKLKVKKICEKYALKYEERPLAPEDITHASECFISSATREVMPVCEIRLENGEKVNFPSGGGELTKNLMKYYKELAAEYIQAHKKEALF